jgi:hypothetical protein
MKSKAMLYLLPVIFCLASCQTAITDDMFPGKYALNTDQHKDSIILNDDHTYQHTYLDSINKLHTCNGKWDLNFNKTVLSLHNFDSFNAQGIKFKGTWKSFLGMDEDSVRIMYASYVVDDDDVEMHYAMKITDQ